MVHFDSPNDTLDFRVIMNTHSADLSMDLTTLATLSIDTGKNGYLPGSDNLDQ